MDLNKAGVIVGILGLLLAVPLAVVGNLITPRLVDWYSATNEHRLQKRIAKLRKMSEMAEATWIFTDAEWSLFSIGVISGQITLLVGYSILGIMLIGLQFTHFQSTVINRTQVEMVKISIAVGIACCWSLLVKLERRHKRSRCLHTAKGRCDLSRQIEKLTSTSDNSGSYKRNCCDSKAPRSDY